ncbi:hypothetical protein [Erwinia phage Snitter]|nr:hypothetical protein [Erwinia phage Snitter]
MRMTAALLLALSSSIMLVAISLAAAYLLG